MRSDKMRYIGLLLVSTFLGAAGQLVFKYALGLHSNPILLVGVALYGLATLIYFYVLSGASLSWAYGMNGLAYIFAVVLAPVILHENVPPLRWLGVAIIAVGIALIGYS